MVAKEIGNHLRVSQRSMQLHSASLNGNNAVAVHRAQLGRKIPLTGPEVQNNDLVHSVYALRTFRYLVDQRRKLSDFMGFLHGTAAAKALDCRSVQFCDYSWCPQSKVAE
jgi:hypothetical protein